MEMPLGLHLNSLFLHGAVFAGEISKKRVDEGVRRVLKALKKVGQFPGQKPGFPSSGKRGAVTRTAQTLSVAREVGARSMILLKNENQTLPLTELQLVKAGNHIGESESSSSAAGIQLLLFGCNDMIMSGIT